MNEQNSQIAGAPESETVSARAEWAKPEITDFQPVTISRGISLNLGDGVSNLT